MKTSSFSQTLLLILASGLILTGCSLFQKSDTTEESKTIESQEKVQLTSDDSGLDTFSGTISQLFSRGKNLTCTITHSDEDISTDGTVYVDGNNNRMRGDFTLTSSDGSYDGHVIQKENMSYFWNSESPQGFKSDLSQIEMNTGDTQDASDNLSNETFDYSQEYDYTCSNWKVDETVFQEPSEIEFVDMSEQIQQIQNNLQDIQGLDCGTCDSLSGEAQTACQQALGC